MKSNAMVSRRQLFREMGRDIYRCVASAKECLDEAKAFSEFFASPDSSYGVTLHYPKEFFEDDARRLGIDMDKVGVENAVRMIIEASQERTEDDAS